MKFQKLSLKKVNGNKQDKLLFSQDGIIDKDILLRNLQTTLPVDSELWQSATKNGRRRLVIGPENTGLIGGRGNSIVPSIPWESGEWEMIRNFTLKNVEELVKKKIVSKDVIPTVLINYYPNGTGSISYHRDKTDNCLNTIVSYSFGPKEMKRKFLIRNIHTGNEGSVYLRHGDALIMTGDFNTNYEHAIESLKKSDPNWEYSRYNLTIRFITPKNPKTTIPREIDWKSNNDGVIQFKDVVDNNHPLKNIKFIPSYLVHKYLTKYMFRIKNWGNVGDFIYDKKEIKHLASLKHKTKVRELPDFYVYVSTRRAFDYLLNILNELKVYFQWRYPRTSNSKVGNISLAKFIDTIFNYYDEDGNCNYSIHPEYKEGINDLLEKKSNKKVIDKRYGFNVEEYGRIQPMDITKKGITWAKQCNITVNGEDMTVRGLNMQYPYAGYLVDGEKSIETRTWNLNPKLIGEYIAIIETPGKLGKKNGVNKARIIGYVKFSDTFSYDTPESWDNDRRKHLCDFKLDGTKY